LQECEEGSRSSDWPKMWQRAGPKKDALYVVVGITLFTWPHCGRNKEFAYKFFT
jgi:hypothetical protein